MNRGTSSQGRRSQNKTSEEAFAIVGARRSFKMIKLKIAEMIDKRKEESDTEIVDSAPTWVGLRENVNHSSTLLLDVV